MSDRTLITHCSPTLAGMKTGNLFSCRYSSSDQLYGFAVKWNEELNPRGVHVRVMRACNGMALIYVYRKIKLEKELQDSKVKSFMENRGYNCRDIGEMLNLLAERLQKMAGFRMRLVFFSDIPLKMSENS